MKNLLSENMLRFGTKNLSEAAQRELTLKSIMETINAYGLHNEVRRHLTEAPAASQSTIMAALVNENNGTPLNWTWKAGSTYTQQNTYAANALQMTPGKDYIFIMPKGTVWNVSADRKLLIAKAKQVKVSDVETVTRKDKNGNFLKWQDLIGMGVFLAKLANGQVNGFINGASTPIKPVDVTVGINPQMPNTIGTSQGDVSIINRPPEYVDNFIGANGALSKLADKRG